MDVSNTSADNHGANRRTKMRRILAFMARAALAITIAVVVFLLVSMARTIRDISKENRQLNQQNLTYMRCLATVFATYTQNGIPVTIENLDKCTVRRVDGSITPVTSLPSESGGASVTTTPEAPKEAPKETPQDTPQDKVCVTVPVIKGETCVTP